MPSGHEWDVVSISQDSSTLLLGECKCLSKEAEQADIDKIVHLIMTKNIPHLKKAENMKKEYMIFVPKTNTKRFSLPPNVHITDSQQIFNILI